MDVKVDTSVCDLCEDVDDLRFELGVKNSVSESKLCGTFCPGVFNLTEKVETRGGTCEECRRVLIVIITDNVRARGRYKRGVVVC